MTIITLHVFKQLDIQHLVHGTAILQQLDTFGILLPLLAVLDPVHSHTIIKTILSTLVSCT